LNVRLSVSYKAANSNKRDPRAYDPVLLKRRAGAAGNPFYISVREQGVKHTVPLGIAPHGRAARGNPRQIEEEWLEVPGILILGTFGIFPIRNPQQKWPHRSLNRVQTIATLIGFHTDLPTKRCLEFLPRDRAARHSAQCE